ncbi:MAG: rod shape-determining protein MreC [Candidatus Veblenbacteria bacterium]|nr:rod shape-determining protein MreC [Candidatus Veblenbacteria bacterium]MDZ4229753.1 rod shape-determining protein MreC [Candidatus Veblenbacteria bacterium]
MRRTLRRAIVAVLILTLTIILAVGPLWPPLQNITQPWLAPLTRWASGLGDWTRQVWQVSALGLENESLRHQVAELNARQATAEAVRQENEELRRLASLPVAAGYERVAVEVIGRQEDETGTSYIVNRGRRDGLEVGLALVAGAAEEDSGIAGLLLVGTITEVGEQVARFRLTTSSASRVLVQLAQTVTARSLAVGEYNLAVRLRFLELDQPVAVGDTVVTSNLNQLVPPGLLVGTVTTVERQEYELFQTAVVTPPVPLERFRFLYVLRPLATPQP